MRQQILMGVAVFACMLMALPVMADQGESSAPERDIGAPIIEAPKAPQAGSAIADGGGKQGTHIAWTTGSGPGNDVGFDNSTMTSDNTVHGLIIGNGFAVGAGQSFSSSASLSGLSGLNGQMSFSQNSGANSVLGAGVSVTFINNQGASNGPIILDGKLLSDMTVTNVDNGDGYTSKEGILNQEVGPGQSAVGDGIASASGGGCGTTHTAWTTGSGTGNDVGFYQSQLASSNFLGAVVAMNRVEIQGEGAAVNLSASLNGMSQANGQFSVVQNSGMNSIVGGGTAVNFINNVTAYSEL